MKRKYEPLQLLQRRGNAPRVSDSGGRYGARIDSTGFMWREKEEELLPQRQQQPLHASIWDIQTRKSLDWTPSLKYGGPERSEHGNTTCKKDTFIILTAANRGRDAFKRLTERVTISQTLPEPETAEVPANASCATARTVFLL
ncbi:uncharacterized protein V6R79_000848 [Siganus canaliculatus]